MPLYHKDVYLPDIAKTLQFAVMLKYSAHARQEAINDKRGHIPLPPVFDSRKAELIEVETNGSKVVKTLYRMPLDENRDMCIVLIPDNGLVKTVWANDKTDYHRTLDRSKYATA